MTKTISVIIPVFNEGRTISSVIDIVCAWGLAEQIIVVNDGSTDDTRLALGKFKDLITLITHQKNYGKGHAIARGVYESRSELLLLLDGDLVGLTRGDLDLLRETFTKRRADMVLGVPSVWGVGKLPLYQKLTGQRILRRSDILPTLGAIQKSGYGLELLLNRMYLGKNIVKVMLPHAYILRKSEKHSASQVIFGHLRESYDIMRQISKNALEDFQLTPRVPL